jgi:hypothetical protein
MCPEDDDGRCAHYVFPMKIMYLPNSMAAGDSIVVMVGDFPGLQSGPKVTSLVARSSRGRCTKHLRRIRDVTHIRREPGACHANVTRKVCVRCVSCASCEDRATRDVTFGPLCTTIVIFFLLHFVNGTK